MFDRWDIGLNRFTGVGLEWLGEGASKPGFIPTLARLSMTGRLVKQTRLGVSSSSLLLFVVEL